MSGSALFVAVFLACVVEAVEALTIILRPELRGIGGRPFWGCWADWCSWW